MSRGMDIGGIRESKDIPENVKDLIIELVSRLQSLERQVTGSIELAYRRGEQLEVMSEQELQPVIDILEHYFSEQLGEGAVEDIAQEIEAKLKAMGYEQVWEKCPDCNGKTEKLVERKDGKQIHIDYHCSTCKGTGKITNKVEWDREKVACVICGRRTRTNCMLTFKDMACHWCKESLELADQLHKELTGGDK